MGPICWLRRINLNDISIFRIYDVWTFLSFIYFSFFQYNRFSVNAQRILPLYLYNRKYHFAMSSLVQIVQNTFFLKIVCVTLSWFKKIYWEKTTNNRLLTGCEVINRTLSKWWTFKLKARGRRHTYKTYVNKNV